MKYLLFIVIALTTPKILVAQDIKNEIESLNKINNFFKSERKTYSSFINELTNVNVTKKSVLWYNYKKTEALYYGNPFSINVTVCTKGDEIFYLLLSFDIDATKFLLEESLTNKKLKDLLSEWKILEKDKNKFYTIIYQNSELIKEFENSISSYLGNLSSVKTDPSIEIAYSTLLNFYSNYDYGNICYGNSVEPIGRKYIEILITEKRIDLIKNILRGYNPEGRMYAIEALLRINSYDENSLDDEDFNVINKIIKLPLIVRTCYGSFVDYESCKTIYSKILKMKK